MCQEIFEAGVPRSDVAKAESLVKSLTRSPTRSLAVAGLRILEVDVLIVLFCLSRSMILWDVHGFGKFLQSTRVYEGSTSSLHSWRRRCNSHTMFGTQKTSRLKWNCAQKRFWFFDFLSLLKLLYLSWLFCVHFRFVKVSRVNSKAGWGEARGWAVGQRDAWAVWAVWVWKHFRFWQGSELLEIHRFFSLTIWENQIITCKGGRNADVSLGVLGDSVAVPWPTWAGQTLRVTASGTCTIEMCAWNVPEVHIHQSFVHLNVLASASCHCGAHSQNFYCKVACHGSLIVDAKQLQRAKLFPSKKEEIPRKVCITFFRASMSFSNFLSFCDVLCRRQV